MRHASRSCPREGAAGPRRLGRTAALLLLVAVFIQAATGNDVAAASLHGVSGQPLEPALSAVLRQARVRGARSGAMHSPHSTPPLTGWIHHNGA